VTLRKILIYIFIWIAVPLLFYRCANPVMPSGGKKDIRPPVVTETDPPNYTTFFKERELRIFFDEFVALKDVDKQMIISPPLQERADLRVRGRSVILKFDKEEKLKENTTYSIFFGNAIQDLNEGNPLGNFIYVFSTGERLDSLSIYGEAHMAFDLAPAEETFIMLYTDNNDTLPLDSLPYYVRPEYIAKTDAEGHYGIYNLPGKDFKLFAIKDINSNYLFDLPSEEIAFLDSLIYPDFVPIPTSLKNTDSLPTDSLNNDSLLESLELIREELKIPLAPFSMDSMPDSLRSDSNRLPAHFYKLFLFAEVDTIQKTIDKTLIDSGHYRIMMRYPTKKLQLTEIEKKDTNNWLLTEYNKTNDTIDLWYVHPPSDSAVFCLYNMDTIVDTLYVALKKQEKKSTRRRERKKEEEDKKSTPPINMKNSGQQNFDFFKPFYFVFATPIDSIIEKPWFFVANEDTIPAPLRWFTDSTVQRKLFVDYEWKPESEYNLIVPDSVFFDIFGRSHDSLEIRFKTKALSEYGTLKMDFKNSKKSPLIIEMYTENDQLIRRDRIEQSVVFDYGYIKPGKYKFKCIIDKNDNGQWDTGNYGELLQPETILWYPKLIEIRGNWDIEDEWEIAP